MGQTRQPLPVLLISAITSSLPEAFDWARGRMEREWGPIVDEGPRFDFAQTSFYRASMGPGLEKQLFALEPVIDPQQLPGIKLQTNAWEQEFAEQGEFPMQRPLNLDPGYVTEAKLVLATVKDRDHRIYLSDGIFAEVTVSYWERRWNRHRWTYPDYMLEENVQFLERCRLRLRRHLGRV